jgi:hypothetical protein
VRPSRERLDFSVYLRAFGVFARNPTVIVLPLMAGVLGILVSQFFAAGIGGGGFIASLTTFLLLLIQLFALGVSIIIADAGWRKGSASFDDAWQDARHKGRDILFAAFGFTFVLNIAQYAGTILGGTIGIILLAIAMYGLIYTIAAAAIGGIPGGAAISVSIERVRSAPMAAALLAVVSLVLLFYVGNLLDQWLFVALGITSEILASVLGAVIQAILTAYIAVVMAKVYSDVSFTTPRW